MHQFDSTQSAAGRVKGFEPEHRPDDPFDRAMSLLHQVVYVLALANLDRLAGFLLECLESGSIGATLVDRDFVRQAVLPNRFLEEAPRGFLVAMGGEEKVDGLSFFVDGA